ncbi:MAG TPA: hypothetical protein VNW92_01895 [Polyangiaceae bacterium]|nr:hypothetical protein [Polyangiaceae bacterium]
MVLLIPVAEDLYYLAYAPDPAVVPRSFVKPAVCTLGKPRWTPALILQVSDCPTPQTLCPSKAQ